MMNKRVVKPTNKCIQNDEMFLCLVAQFVTFENSIDYREIYRVL